MKAAAAVLSVAFLAGCPASTGPTEELKVDFEFGIQRLQTEPAFVVNAGAGEITIRGYFDTPCSPYSAIARAKVTDNHLTVYVHGRQPGACWDVIGATAYQATIQIPAGTYDVDAAHTYPTNQSTTRIVVASQVVVR